MPTSNAQKKKQSIIDYVPWLQGASFEEAHYFYEGLAKADNQTIADLAKHDRYFLLTHALRRTDAIHPWLYARCREVEANPDGYLDLWAREHYKSTIITYAGIIQEIIKDPEITIGIFSHTRPISKAFLDQIKQEFERNEVLKILYPDIFWDNPRSDAPTWSLDAGIVVKRKANPKEKTVEAHGLVDGQPTSKHFKLMIYDDVVTRESVNTPDQITKTTDAWELSRNLSSKDEKTDERRTWMIGTRYNYADTYQVIMDRGAAIPRLYPATEDGTMDGKPVFMTEKEWDKKKKESSLATIACQQLQNPNAGSQQEFKPEWIQNYEIRPKTVNIYITVDYAGSRANTGSSNTAMSVIAVDYALNKYLVDGVCHKLSLNDRWETLKNLRNKWIRQPGVQIVEVGYERYGAQADIEHFEKMMEIEGNPFPIKELNWPRDGNHAKDERIRRLEPDFRNWRIFFPYSGDQTKLQREAANNGDAALIAKPIRKVNQDKKPYDLVEWFIRNEYLFFPNTIMKDFLDALSRIYDMDIKAPIVYHDEDIYPEHEE